MIEPIVPHYADGSEPDAFEWHIEAGVIDIYDVDDHGFRVRLRINTDGLILGV